MSFTLRIRFTGMCLFIRDGSSWVHVLLPSTAGTFPVPPQAMGTGHEHDEQGQSGSGCGTCTEDGMTIEPHAVRITLDTAHMHPGRVSKDNVLAHLSLKDRVLEVARDGRALNATLPADLVSLGGNLREEVFGTDAGDLLSARISFASGECSGVAPGRCWSWRGTVRRMTHVVEWTIADVPGDELRLPLKQFSGAFGGSLGPFFPVNGAIELTVMHAPYTDMPPDPLPLPELDPANPPVAHHFAAMLRLFQEPVYDLPVYVGDECGKSGLVREDLDDREKGTASLSCMGGQG
jgi:hypothetical protein